MSSMYVLDKNGEPKVETDASKWSEWLDSHSRQVARTVVHGKEIEILVSTVFLGLDNGSGEGPQLLYETMIFDDSGRERFNCHQDRYSTKEEALAGHKRAAKMAKDKLKEASE